MTPFQKWLCGGISLCVILLFLFNPIITGTQAAVWSGDENIRRIDLTSDSLLNTARFIEDDPCAATDPDPYPYPYPNTDPYPYPAPGSDLDRAMDLRYFSGWQAAWRDPLNSDIAGYSHKISCSPEQSDGLVWIHGPSSYYLGIQAGDPASDQKGRWKNGSLGWVMENKTGQTLGRLSLRYSGILPSGGADDKIQVSYKIWNNISLLDSGGWTEVDDLTFTAAASTSGVVSADLNVNIPDGSGLILRWKAGAENSARMFGIDDVTLQAYPALPGSSALYVDRDLNPLNGNVVYHTGDVVRIAVTYPEAVQVNGEEKPYIAMRIGNDQNARMEYQSGNGTNDAPLLFDYTIQSSDHDPNGIELDTFITIPDNASITIPNLAGWVADRDFKFKNSALLVIQTSIMNVVLQEPSAPQNVFLRGDSLTFQIKFYDLVTVTGTPTLPLRVGDAWVDAKYTSGSGTDTLTFVYAVGAGDHSDSGIMAGNSLSLAGGTIVDSSGCPVVLTLYNVPSLDDVKVEGRIQPVAFDVSKAGLYASGGRIEFLVDYDQPLTVDTSGGTPALQLSLGVNGEEYNYVTADFDHRVGQDTLAFDYIVKTGDDDSDGIRLTGISLNHGAILDEAGTAVSTDFDTILPAERVKVDARAPRNKTLQPPAKGDYGRGAAVDFVLTWDEPVVVVGTPRLVLLLGDQTRKVDYVSSSSTNQLTFRYIVQAGDLGKPSLEVGMDFSDGSIRDLAGNESSPYLMYFPGLLDVRVDGRIPEVSSHSAGADEMDAPLDANLTVTFSMPVTLRSGWFSLTCELSGNHTVKETHVDRTYTLDPQEDFQNGEACTVRISKAAVTNTMGIPMAEDAAWTFITHIITQPPVIDLPVGPTESVQPDGFFSVRFPALVRFKNAQNWLTIQCSVSGAHAYTAAASKDALRYTITPVKPYARGETCTVTLRADQVTAIETGSRLLAQDLVQTFKTTEGYSVFLPVILNPGGAAKTK
jgi:hypothetical protein